MGTTPVLGWPLSDWAFLLLLFVLSVLAVAILGALIGVILSWLRRPDRPAAVSAPHQDADKPVS